MTNLSSSTLDPETLAQLQGWIGRSETQQDEITRVPLRALSATLDRDDPPVADGTEVPPLWHWLYFLPHHRQGETGPDGHARRGGFLPPVPLPRRMWAGGRLVWEPGNPLRAGDAVTRVSTIKGITHKAGRTGDLLFVLVQHVYSNASGVALSEEHDIVYRAAAQPGDPAPPPVAADKHAPWQRSLVPDEVLLFRYSALTFNGHRIHYDRSYVTSEESYPGLVVHGPLIATLLVDLVRRSAPDRRLRRFAFKAVRPSFDGRALTLSGQPDAEGRVCLWSQDAEGFLTMQADAELI